MIACNPFYISNLSAEIFARSNVLGAGSRRFKSCRPDQISFVFRGIFAEPRTCLKCRRSGVPALKTLDLVSINACEVVTSTYNFDYSGLRKMCCTPYCGTDLYSNHG